MLAAVLLLSMTTPDLQQRLEFMASIRVGDTRWVSGVRYRVYLVAGDELFIDRKGPDDECASHAGVIGRVDWSELFARRVEDYP